MGMLEVVNPVRELLLYDTSKWLVYYWGHPEYARTIPLATLEKIQKVFRGDDLEIIRTPSGAILIVQKMVEGLTPVDEMIARDTFRKIILELLGPKA